MMSDPKGAGGSFLRTSSDPSRTESPDIGNGAIVRVERFLVIDGGGTDGDGGGFASGGAVADVFEIFPSGNDGGNTRGDELAYGVVEGIGVATARAQGSDRRATSGTSGSDDPVKCCWEDDHQHNRN